MASEEEKQEALKKAREEEKKSKELPDLKELKRDDKEFLKEAEQLKKMLKHKGKLK